MALPAAVVYSDLWVCSGLGTFPFCRLRFRGSHLLFCSMLCGLSRVCLCFKRRKETFALLVSASPTPLLREPSSFNSRMGSKLSLCREKHTSAMVKDTIKAINEVVLDAEVETFLLKKELGESSSSVKRFAYATVKSMVLGFDMKPIRKRISKVILDMQNLGVQSVIVDEEYMESLLFERKCAWQAILRQLRPECDVSKMMEEELLEKIVRVLETQKALIVIDDIWRERRRLGPNQACVSAKKGWKVLLTSRSEDVALLADKKCATFKPGCLTFEDSWDLLQRITFPIQDTAENKIVEDMKERKGPPEK
ncbi:hypothetical protein HID58_049669 [Brassica napus]|uniref:NB-ARC domain-containing protein n=1 Tax=Brassica napus TaxID=3708 RepID=A0ABQ8B5M6_BRANA|nr:hypothetical protein HID58_049669 [Brassica napus]